MLLTCQDMVVVHLQMVEVVETTKMLVEVVERAMTQQV